MQRRLLILNILVSAIVAILIAVAASRLPRETITAFLPEPTPIPTPFARYEIENLAQKEVPEREIEVREIIEEEESYSSFLFEHAFDPTLETGEQKIVTGQINLPNEPGEYPLVLMFRGYVDQELYETGTGTKSAAAFFADNGMITVAPDFLGYGGSSSESDAIFETRFQTYTTALSILASLVSIDKWDKKNIFIWAHSNGGQVALTLLAITQKEIPTALWAPVTKPFPYSILYYTDESDDGGKFIRRELAKFEEIYDVDKFSFTNFLDRVSAPILLHQGTADDAVPVGWSDQFAKNLEKLDVDLIFLKYPGADHNLRPVWDSVIEEDLEFFNSKLKV